MSGRAVLRLFFAGLPLSILGMLGVGPDLAAAAPAKGPGKITVYCQSGGEEGVLYTLDPETGSRTRIAGYPVRNGVVPMADFRVSPDGNRLAFNVFKDPQSYRSMDSVWVQEIRPNVVPGMVSNLGGYPVWSPDGKQLLITVPVGDPGPAPPKRYRYATWRVGADGSGAVRVPIPGDVFVEDWSPDGEWVAGVAPVPGGDYEVEIVVMHPDGTGRCRVAGPGANFRPRFSPDGRQVAYVASPSGPKAGMKGNSVWVVGVDGKGLRRIYLERNDENIDRVEWSPDGNRLLTVLKTWTKTESRGETPTNPRLCIIDVASGRTTAIPHPPVEVMGHPQWR